MKANKNMLIVYAVISFLLGTVVTLFSYKLYSSSLIPRGEVEITFSENGNKYLLIKNAGTDQYWVNEKAIIGNSRILWDNIKVDCANLSTKIVERRIFDSNGIFLERQNNATTGNSIPETLTLIAECI